MTINGETQTLEQQIKLCKNELKRTESELREITFNDTELKAIHDRDYAYRMYQTFNAIKNYIKNETKQNNCRNNNDFDRLEKAMKKHINIIRKNFNGNAYELIREYNGQ